MAKKPKTVPGSTWPLYQPHLHENAVSDMDAVQRDFVAGLSYRDMAKRHGVSTTTIANYAKKYNWSTALRNEGTNAQRVARAAAKREKAAPPPATSPYAVGTLNPPLPLNPGLRGAAAVAQPRVRSEPKQDEGAEPPHDAATCATAGTEDRTGDDDKGQGGNPSADQSGDCKPCLSPVQAYPASWGMPEFSAWCEYFATTGMTNTSRRERSDLPPLEWVLAVVNSSPELRARYEEARRLSCDPIEHSIASILHANAFDASAARVRVEVATKLLQWRDPTRYSNKGQGEQTLSITIADVQRDASAILAARQVDRPMGPRRAH